jgi:hypothetical protein
VRRQDHWLPGLLREVEVLREVTKLGNGFAAIGTRVWPAVRFRIDSLAAKDVVLDELQVRVEAQRLVVDVALLRRRSAL